MSATASPRDPFAALIEEGLVHHRAGRFGEAERICRDVLRRDSAHPRALHLLGVIAGQAGDYARALDLLQRALARDPDNAFIYRDIGEAFASLGDFARAFEAFDWALELKPDLDPVYRRAAEAAEVQGEQHTAAGRARQAREARRRAGAYLYRMAMLPHRRWLPESEKTFREAIALDPENAGALLGLGSFLFGEGRLAEAEKTLRRAVALEPHPPGASDPRFALAQAELGNVLLAQGRLAKAEAAYRKALAMEPELSLARQGLIALRLMTPLYGEATTPAQILLAHRAWGEEITARLDETAPSFANPRNPDRRLKLGYVSPDFQRHSVSYFFEPLLAQHDPAQVETFCYAEIENPDAVTERLQRLAGHWRSSVAMSDAALRRQIREDGIDILVDLAGHSSRSRLAAFAVKPAPVTATWLGYPATTGLATIDWRLTDEIADPPGAERFHTEKLLRLPHGFLCYLPPTEAPDVTPLPARSTGQVTFGSFNNPDKMTPGTIAAWARILFFVPQARLILKARVFRDGDTRARILGLFREQGIKPGRVELRPTVAELAGHLGAYGEVDIALDPFPYNGTTTSCEALWMGVPVVSLIGDRHAGRVGLDLLSRVGLSELAAPDTESYVATAVGLARDLPALARLRGSLRERLRASPLCDAPRFARDFEAALRRMWRHWCESAP